MTSCCTRRLDQVSLQAKAQLRDGSKSPQMLEFTHMSVNSVSQSSSAKSPVARKRNRAQGRKQAFAIESIAKIKSHLMERNDRRGLALLLTSLDTCLRSCDLLSLRVSDVVDHNMQIVGRFQFRQA